MGDRGVPGCWAFSGLHGTQSSALDKTLSCGSDASLP